jgi:hypothetical protein
MSDPQQIEHDLREYLKKEPNMERAARLEHLKIIFEKHLELSKLDHLVTYKDVFNIFSEARNYLIKTKFPVFIGKKQLETSETTHVAIMEAFILYLNRMQLLKKLVKFDYRE